MKEFRFICKTLLAVAAAAVILGPGTTVVTATEPCDDFGECKVLIEINATDGDIGFHFLADGDDLISNRLTDPDGKKVFEDLAKGSLVDQFMTEQFVESAEPLCWDSPDAEEDDEIVTLEEFLERWAEGTYVFTARGEEGELSEGETELTYEIPAAPADLAFNAITNVITWDGGDDLGNCATNAELDMLVMAEVLTEHPEDVDVDAWEIVLEPDVDDGDPLGALKYTVRVTGDVNFFDPTVGISVPAEYLASLPDNTLAKMEVGAIGGEDNATFTEIFDICLNEVGAGCD